jgi:hypothetical protein
MNEAESLNEKVQVSLILGGANGWKIDQSHIALLHKDIDKMKHLIEDL